MIGFFKLVYYKISVAIMRVRLDKQRAVNAKLIKEKEELLKKISEWINEE